MSLALRQPPRAAAAGGRGRRVRKIVVLCTAAAGAAWLRIGGAPAAAAAATPVASPAAEVEGDDSGSSNDGAGAQQALKGTALSEDAQGDRYASWLQRDRSSGSGGSGSSPAAVAAPAADSFGGAARRRLTDWALDAWRAVNGGLRRVKQLSGALEQMPKVNLADVSNDASATCDDGSPGSYYFAPATGPSNKWLFLLGGGGWCWDAASCDGWRRWVKLSPPAAEDGRVDPESILGSNGGFTDFHRAFVPLCSGDAWMGDVGTSDAAGVNFRGARIFREALRHVVARGMQDGDFLVFGGVSAGGRGAMVHLDALKEEGLVPSGVHILGYLDSPYYVETPAFGNLTAARHRVGLQTRLAVSAAGSEKLVRGGGLCDLPEAWHCAFGEYRIPLLRTPFLLVASQYDSFQLAVAEGALLFPPRCFPEPRCDYMQYADDFAQITRHGLTSLPQVVAGTSGLFASDCYDHAVSLDSRFSTQRVGGVSRAEALRQAIEATTAPPQAFVRGSGPLGGPLRRMPNVVSDCGALNCGESCPKVDPSCFCQHTEDGSGRR